MIMVISYYWTLLLIEKLSSYSYLKNVVILGVFRFEDNKKTHFKYENRQKSIYIYKKNVNTIWTKNLNRFQPN